VSTTTEIRRFRSASADKAAETWRHFAPSSELLGVDEQRCRLDWVSYTAPGFSLIRYDMAADVRSSIEPSDQLFACRVTMNPGVLSTRQRDLDASRPWATTGELVTAQWAESASVHALVFDKESATELAGQMVGDDTVQLIVKRPEAISHDAASQWDLALRYLASALTVTHAELEDASLITAGPRRHALWMTLTTFATTFTDTLQRSAQTMAAPKTVRRALAFIDANAHLPITIDDVALDARISTRGLQYAFRRSLDASPTDFLRRARLNGARDDLRSAGPHDSVTSVARRWGFTNVSRFTACFRDEFGERP